MSSTRVTTAVSQLADATAAVNDIRRQLGENLSALIVFCSSNYDLACLGRELQQQFSCPILGCTTAGEIIHSHGYVEKSIVAMGFGPGSLCLDPVLIQPLNAHAAGDFSGMDGITTMVHRQLQQAVKPDFGLLLCDGLSGCEELVIAAVQHSLANCPIIGGSAGDDTRFAATHVYYRGAFHRHAAVIGLCRSSVFHAEALQIQHFIPSQRKLVITAAQPRQRLVREIDGIPAAQAYAAAIGCAPEDLDTQAFAAHPLMLRLGGRWFVRSVQKRHADDSLTFYCAIEEGLVLTMGQAGDMAEGLQQALLALAGEKDDHNHAVQAIIAFDCILRRIDAARQGSLAALAKIIAQHPLVGMSTYGEQCHGIHVNHTMTGMVLRGRS